MTAQSDVREGTTVTVNGSVPGPDPLRATSVLVGVDGSSHNAAAVEWAATEAAEHGLDLVLVCVREEGEGADGSESPLEAAARATLEQAVRQVRRSHPGLPVRTEVRSGRAGEALIEGDPEVVVVGRRGAGGFARMLLGSTSLWTAGASPGVVVVIPSQAPTSPADTYTDEVTVGGVLAAVDPLAPDQEVLRFAFERARQRALPLRVLAAWEAPPVLAHGRAGIRQAWHREEARIARALDEVLQPWVDGYPEVAVEQLVVHGHPAGTILELQTGQELTVLGRGGGRLGGFRLGPITRSVLHLSAGPVAVVP